MGYRAMYRTPRMLLLMAICAGGLSMTGCMTLGRRSLSRAKEELNESSSSSSSSAAAAAKSGSGKLPTPEDEFHLMPNLKSANGVTQVESKIVLVGYGDAISGDYEIYRLPKVTGDGNAPSGVVYELNRDLSAQGGRGTTQVIHADPIVSTLFPLPTVDKTRPFADLTPGGFADVSPDATGQPLPLVLDDQNVNPGWSYPRWRYFREVGGRIGEDYSHFYSGQNLAILAAGLGIGATIANTNADEVARDFLKENLVYTPSDEYAELTRQYKFLGDGTYLIPAYAAAALLGNAWGPEAKMPVIGEWGERTTRGLIVGLPAMLALQLATGASRPGEVSDSSRWHPLQDNNGVSGHAFMGAIPLLSAAKMTDQPLLKAVFYTMSTLPGLSRISDDAHYPSQVLLGWGLAYLAVTSVDQTQRGANSISFYPWTNGQATGGAVEMRW